MGEIFNNRGKKNFVPSIDHYVIVNKLILRLVGLYPVDSQRYGICILLMLLIVVPQVSHIYLNRKDFSLIIETSSVLSTVLLAILKSLIWLWNSGTPKIVGFMMNDYWRIAEGFDSNCLMQRYAKTGRDVTRGYCFLIANALLVFFTLQPLRFVVSRILNENSEGKKSFPFPAMYPKFCYVSPFYEVAYASQMLATGACGLVILAMDTLIATALFHTAGHFDVLRENLSRLDAYFDRIERSEKIHVTTTEIETREKTIDSKVANYNLRKRLATLVNHHQTIIRFADDMEKSFSPIMLMQVLASTLIICLVGFQVTTTMSEVEKLVEYFSYLMMALFQILLFCWPGDEMIFQSSMIANAAFSMKWYKASSQIKAEVSLIILRSQRPSRLTAGKFYIMCMENFSAILSTSMSYFTLVRSANFN